MTLTGSFEAHDFQMSTDQKGNNKKLLLTTVGDVLMAGVVLVYVVMPHHMNFRFSSISTVRLF